MCIINKLVIWRRNRFQGTGSTVPEPVPKPGTRNRFLNIDGSLTGVLGYCIAIFQSLWHIVQFTCTYAFGVEERLVFGNFSNATRPSFIAIWCRCVLLKRSLSDCWNKLCLTAQTEQGNMWLFTSARRLYFARRLSVCLFVQMITQKYCGDFDET